MPPDFLTPERKKKKNFLETLIRKKIQKSFAVNNKAPGEHTYLPKKTGIFPVKTVRNQDVFVLQK